MTNAPGAAKAGEAPPASLVRAELDRVLTSDLFVRSERLSSFLRFIVERTLAGEGDSLKEPTIAVEVYGKDARFDTAADPIVRIDARRLRDKLREYYADAGGSPLVISVPKGQYAPVFRTNGVTGSPSPPASLRAETPGMARRLLAAGAVVVIASVTWIVKSRVAAEPAPREIIVTSLPGAEDDPSLSPNGRSVVFSWAASPGAYDDIWIKSVEGDQKLNLTNTPEANEHWARWSPDGQFITFSRGTKDGLSSVVVVSVLGGHQEIIATHAGDSSWTPDSRSLVMSRTTADGHRHLIRHDRDTGEEQTLTDTPDGFGEIHPRVSPDGKTLAFIQAGPKGSAIFLVPMAGGTPTILGEWINGTQIGGLDWMPDGRELLASIPVAGIRRLMRVPVKGGWPGVPVPAAPPESAGVSVTGVDRTARLRFAVSTGVPEVRLRLIDLAEARVGEVITTDAPFCDSTRMDDLGRFSPNGDQVAFVSNRDGSFQVWVAKRDGSALRPVTHLKDATITMGSWSPNAERLAFDVTIGDHTDIYVAEVEGSVVRQVSDGLDAREPEWSRDGQWIYFSSNRSGNHAIWRMRAEGGGLTQLTTEPGFELRESPNEQSVYFASEASGTTTLKQVWVESRLVQTLDLRVTAHNWDVTNTGIVFLAERPEGIQNSNRGRNVLQLYDFAERRTHRIGRLAFLVGPYFASRYLAVSRDGRWAVASHLELERDIHVLDGPR
jgi:Tol biopolymer transport system component